MLVPRRIFVLGDVNVLPLSNWLQAAGAPPRSFWIRIGVGVLVSVRVRVRGKIIASYEQVGEGAPT